MTPDLSQALEQAERLLRIRDYDALSTLLSQLRRDAVNWERSDCQLLKDSLVVWLDKVSRDRANYADAISAERGKRGALRSYRAEL